VVRVEDPSGEQPVAALLRVAWATAEAGAPDQLAPDQLAGCRVVLGRDVPAADVTSRARLVECLAGGGEPWSPEGKAREGRAPRVLFFESMMNSDMPHNDQEISQGVLHMASALTAAGGEAVFANVKMPIVGRDRAISGLETLRPLLETPVDLVCVTLLEGYWEGGVTLLSALRDLGCRAHFAFGGVMPTLTPEHVAAHLPDATFVCRGDGERFVPTLAWLCRDQTIDQPLTGLGALLGDEGLLEGLIVIDRAGGSLTSIHSDRVARVDDLDRVPLDLTLVQPRHFQHGVELSTSRGCIHRCTFCSIIGRERYQARSAGSVLDVLEAYDARIRAAFTVRPEGARRVHISDDDFACDRQRAAELLRGILDTPFRLSSVQVSIADLCRHEDGALAPELDPELWDAIRPACFADAGRPISHRDFVLDHRSRTWSSFLQIGVESFCDRELVRLGKGFRVAHIRAVAEACAQRGIHWDAYFILSNADTRAEELIDGLLEVIRLKIAYPTTFHVRFPIVPRLVSYFPSASRRRLVRQGRASVQQTREWLRAESFHEYDYPLVDHDRCDDPWVEAVLPEHDGADQESFFTDRRLYTEAARRLRERWIARLAETTDPQERLRGEFLARRLDDVRRRLALDNLVAARRTWRADEALRVTEGLLGDLEDWRSALAHAAEGTPPRLVVIPTWQCELRCSYCFIPKQDGRVMDARTLLRGIEFLLSSDRDELILQFFGGEALMEWDLVKLAVSGASRRAAQLGRSMQFIVSSNGVLLDRDKLAWLKDHDVKLELSLDGDRELQNRFRATADRAGDSYDSGIAPRARMIVESGLPYEVIMVVHPRNAHLLAGSFFHIASLGFERIQINHALGMRWSSAHKTAFAQQLFEIGNELKARRARGSRLVLVNAESRALPVRLNGEITLDWDGTLYGGNGFLHETEHKEKFRVGHLDDLGGFDRYWLDRPSNEYLLEWSYPPEITANNLAVGRIMASFAGWLRSSLQPSLPSGAGDRP